MSAAYIHTHIHSHTHTHTKWNIIHYNVFLGNRITGSPDFVPYTFLCFTNFLQWKLITCIFKKSINKMLKIKNINSLRILSFPKSSCIKPRYLTPQSLTQKMCICVCMCTSTHLSTHLWLILSNLNYGILCGILVGMGGGAGETGQAPGNRPSSFRSAKTGVHQNGCWSAKLLKHRRRMGRKKPTLVFSTSPKLKKQKGRVPNCRHGLVSELLLPGAILCSCSWVTSCND